MGPVRGPWTGHRRGHSPHQVAGRPEPYPLGLRHAYIDAARTWAYDIGQAPQNQYFPDADRAITAHRRRPNTRGSAAISQSENGTFDAECTPTLTLARLSVRRRLP